MQSIWLRILLLVGIAITIDCSGGSNPMQPPGGGGTSSSATVVSGRTGDVVPVVPLASGHFVFREQGFLTYDTTVPRTGIVYLWPADDGWITAQYSRSAAYGLVAEDPRPGILYRIPDSVRLATIVPSAELMAIPEAVQALERSADLASRLTRDAPVPLTIQVRREGGPFPVPLYVDANDPAFVTYPGAGAVAYAQYSTTGVVVGAKIVVRCLLSCFFNWENFTIGMAHEMGHGLLSLSHLDPDGPAGIMSATAVLYNYRDFTEREKLVVTMMRRRLPGITLTGTVESDRAFATTEQPTETTWRLVCILESL